MKKWKDFFNKFGTFEQFAGIANVSLSTVKNWSKQNRVPPSKHCIMIDIATMSAIKLNEGIIKRMEKK